MYSENNRLNIQLKIWMIALLLMIILIIFVGGLTRLTDSGLSITTWELFIGSLPPLTKEKWLEYSLIIRRSSKFLIEYLNDYSHCT